MMLMHPTFEEPITIERDDINVLVVENRDQLAEYIRMLNGQIHGDDGKFVLSDDGRCQSLSGTVKLIIDPFNLDVNTKDVLTQSYGILNKIAMDEDHYCNTNEAVQGFTRYILELLVDADVEMYLKDCSFSDFIKLLSPRFMQSDDLLATVAEYLDVMSRYSKVVLFIFVNLYTFLSEEKMSLLKQHILYRRYSVLFIESVFECRNGENITIIDKDRCEMRRQEVI